MDLCHSPSHLLINYSLTHSSLSLPFVLCRYARALFRRAACLLEKGNGWPIYTFSLIYIYPLLPSYTCNGWPIYIYPLLPSVLVYKNHHSPLFIIPLSLPPISLSPRRCLGRGGRLQGPVPCRSLLACPARLACESLLSAEKTGTPPLPSCLNDIALYHPVCYATLTYHVMIPSLLIDYWLW